MNVKPFCINYDHCLFGPTILEKWQTSERADGEKKYFTRSIEPLQFFTMLQYHPPSSSCPTLHIKKTGVTMIIKFECRNATVAISSNRSRQAFSVAKEYSSCLWSMLRWLKILVKACCCPTPMQQSACQEWIEFMEMADTAILPTLKQMSNIYYFNVKVNSHKSFVFNLQKQIILVHPIFENGIF